MKEKTARANNSLIIHVLKSLDGYPSFLKLITNVNDLIGCLNSCNICQEKGKIKDDGVWDADRPLCFALPRGFEAKTRQFQQNQQ